MNPIEFKGQNRQLVAPADLTETQVRTIPGYVATIEGGSLDGELVVVVAWQPTTLELADIVSGKPIYLSCIGGLPPHFLTTNFEQATKPA